MAAVTPAVTPIPITFCPPMPARYRLPDEPQFQRTKYGAVTHAKRNAGGDEISPTCLSYDDATRMSCTLHVVQRKRRLATPDWALDDRLLRKLLCAFMVRKALLKVPIPDDLESQRALLARADERLKSQLPMLEERVTRLCQQYVIAPSESMRNKIRTIDGDIICRRRGAALVVAVVAAYYRRGLSSVETAEECKLPTATYCRQLIHRLHRAWEALANEPVQKVKRTESARVAAIAGWRKRKMAPTEAGAAKKQQTAHA